MLHILLTAAVLAAPVQRPAEIVRWSAGDVTSARAGQTTNVHITAKVQRGWKLYAIDQAKDGPEPLAFQVANAQAEPDASVSPPTFVLVVKNIVAPKAKEQKDDNFGLVTRYYENDVAFTVPLRVSTAASPGRHSVPIEVTFQACGQNICLRPYTQRLDVTATVVR